MTEARGEITAGLVLALLGWLYSRYRMLMRNYRRKKQELERIENEMFRLGATKQEIERLQAELKESEAQRQDIQTQLEQAKAEIQRKDEALRESEAQKAEEARQKAEIQRQLDVLRQELEREKAKKRIPPMSDDDFLVLCESGDVTKVAEAIMNGSNVNAKNNDGWTALMLAALNGHADVAEVLLKHGADVNAKNIFGRTALILAAENGYADVAE
ncbi:MAG: ankyrin repeat domain-containing protein, partial [Synergistaceae bacterium]|nr:ankyrin repeat domain-containing protein [Synergistaceae bacterium]